MNVYLRYSFNCWRKWLCILRKWTAKGVWGKIVWSSFFVAASRSSPPSIVSACLGCVFSSPIKKKIYIYMYIYYIIKYNAVTWLCNNLFYSYCKPMLRKSSMRQIDELGYLCRILATKYEGLEASILCGRLCEVSLFDVVVLPFIYLKFTDSVMYDFCWLHMMQLWWQDSLTSRTGGHTIFVIFLLEPVIPLTLSHCSHSQPLCLLSW